MLGGAADDERTALLITELGHATGRCLAVNGDTGHDEVADLKEALRDGAIGAGAVVLATVGGEDLQDLGSENGTGLTKTKVVVDGGLGAENRDGRRSGGQVKRERKDATDGGDRARNFGAFDGAGVPGVSSGLGDSVEELLRRDAAVSGVDRDGFVEDTEEAFDGKGFVIAAGDAVMVDLQDVAHGDEVALEFAVVVDNNEAAETDFEENVAHEEVSQSSRIGCGNVVAKKEAGEVTH